MPKKLIATFDPQVWLNDHALSVDPQGETKWDCTNYVQELKLTDKVEKFIEKEGYWLDCDDVLKEDANAPEWIREWTGPFSITVELHPDHGYADEEVIGLEKDGTVIQWNAATGKPENTGERLDEYGYNNLRKHEINRLLNNKVGLTETDIKMLTS